MGFNICHDKDTGGYGRPREATGGPLEAPGGQFPRTDLGPPTGSSCLQAPPGVLKPYFLMEYLCIYIYIHVQISININ